jgi:YggT family protein
VLVASSVMLLAGWNGQTVVLYALFRFLNWIIFGFMGLLIIEVVFSWINPHAPLAPFVHALNDPLLRPIRRVVPPVGGIDFSVLIALILLQIIKYLLGQALF